MSIHSDRSWNSVLEGESKFEIQSGFFANKSLDLNDKDWGEEKELLKRSTVRPTIFVMISIMIQLVVGGHLGILLVWMLKHPFGKRTRLIVSKKKHFF